VSPLARHVHPSEDTGLTAMSRLSGVQTWPSDLSPTPRQMPRKSGVKIWATSRTPHVSGASTHKR
jgi:hypothetical protein